MMTLLGIFLVVLFGGGAWWMGTQLTDDVRLVLLITFVGCLVGFGLGWVAIAAEREQQAWEAGCAQAGGTVKSVTRSTTGTGVGTNGQPVVTTGSSTTHYCLTSDGRILDIR